jgi:hypothetical protein
MTKKEFLNAISNGKVDIVQAFLDTLSASNADYCVIGGLAVNAYARLLKHILRSNGLLIA